MGNCDPYSDSPEAMVVKQPKFTRAGESALLCNHSQRKRGATDRSNLRSQAPFLDPTRVNRQQLCLSLRLLAAGERMTRGDNAHGKDNR
jgi:hypothetical protein